MRVPLVNYVRFSSISDGNRNDEITLDDSGLVVA